MSDKKLLFSITRKDFDITYFSGSGAGGQYRNKHQNCCRIKHLETGLITTGQEERSKEQNTRNAFKRMTENKDFKIWLKLKIARVCAGEKDERTIDEIVDEAMDEKNIKVEYLEVT